MIFEFGCRLCIHFTMRKGSAFGFDAALMTVAGILSPSSCILPAISAARVRVLARHSCSLNPCLVPSFGFHSSAAIPARKSSGLKPDKSGYEWLRIEINKINNVDDAYGLYRDMARMMPLPTVIQFNQLLTRVIKIKNHGVAITLYKDMCIRRIQVDEYTMSMVINCYCLEGQVDLGFAMLEAFFKRGVEPNVITFNTLLKGYFQMCRVTEAQDLFKKIISEKLCQPYQMMLGILMDGISKAGNTKIAIDFLRIMENADIKPKVIHYNTIIDALIKDAIAWFLPRNDWERHYPRYSYL